MDTHSHEHKQVTHTQMRTYTHTCKLAVILISIEFGWPEIDKHLSHTGASYVTEECRHGQLTILDQSLPRPFCLYSPAMVKIHGSHGECRRERDLYMNCECWCKFINMHQHCWGCYGQYNVTLYVQMLSIQLQYSDQCFVNRFLNFLFFCFVFLRPAIIWGSHAVCSNQTLLLPWSNRTANGGHWQRRGMGPISLLTTDFILRVKGLLSVTFTWFKSLTQLNQKSMKSFGYIFGLSCQHFKLNTNFMTPAERK